MFDDYGQVALDDWQEGRFGDMELSVVAPLLPLDGQFGRFPLLDTPVALDAAVAADAVYPDRPRPRWKMRRQHGSCLIRPVSVPCWRGARPSRFTCKRMRQDARRKHGIS